MGCSSGAAPRSRRDESLVRCPVWRVSCRPVKWPATKMLCNRSPQRDQLRRRLGLAMSRQRVIQERQHGPLLQAQGLHDGEHAFDEAAAVVAVAAEGVLAPQDARTQLALDVIVRG